VILLGFGLGVLLAAQVGPVTLLIVRTVLRGGRAVVVGLAMAAALPASTSSTRRSGSLDSGRSPTCPR
jgi:hypothetical protein